MKKIILLYSIFYSAALFSQNTIGGKVVTVPEAEVIRQSAFLDAERERLLGNHEKAIQLYKAFLLESPTNDAGWYGLARSQAMQKDDVNALGSARKAIDADPVNVWYQVFYADLLEKNGREKDAVKVYESLTKSNPTVPAFYQRLAYLAVLSGDPKGGLKALDRLEVLTGVTEETASKKHMIYVGLGDNKKAANELQKLANAEPEQPEHLRRLARFLEETGDKTAAQKVWQQVLKQNPDDPVAQIAVLDQAKNTGDAAYLESLKPLFRDPKISIDAKVKEVLPYLQKLEKDPALAAKLLELSTLLETAHADDPKAWSLSGDVLYLSNRPADALEKYRRCIALNPTVPTVWENTLRILAEQRDFPEMLKTAERAIDAFPNQAGGYLYYGMAASEMGKFDNALDQLEQALLMSGRNVGVYLDVLDQIGLTLLRKKDYAEAKNRLEPALAKGGDKHPGILEHLGDAHFQLGDRTKAVEFWQKANRIRPTRELEGKISGM